VHLDYELSALLAAFRNEHLITSYLGPLRPGKEAHIHCCRRPDGGYAILKHYTPVSLRGFRSDAIYDMGTSFVQTRERRAIRDASNHGLQIKLKLWTANEYRNAQRLRALGLPVPEPLGHIGPAILMRMIGGPDRPAQQLREAALSAAEAQRLLPRLQADILTMLQQDLIHGDLSAYNVLWHRERHWLIDVPQMVNATVNSAAHELFIRDCVSLLGHLRRCGATIDPLGWATDTWERWASGKILRADAAIADGY
jgi:RIO kinase 1